MDKNGIITQAQRTPRVNNGSNNVRSTVSAAPNPSANVESNVACEAGPGNVSFSPATNAATLTTKASTGHLAEQNQSMENQSGNVRQPISKNGRSSSKGMSRFFCSWFACCRFQRRERARGKTSPGGEANSRSDMKFTEIDSGQSKPADQLVKRVSTQNRTEIDVKSEPKLQGDIEVTTSTGVPTETSPTNKIPLFTSVNLAESNSPGSSSVLPSTTETVSSPGESRVGVVDIHLYPQMQFTNSNEADFAHSLLDDDVHMIHRNADDQESIYTSSSHRQSSLESLVDGTETPIMDEDGEPYEENKFLGAAAPEDCDKICCVIDLDETLVHSSFEPLDSFDFIVEVEIDGDMHPVYVCKRPYVDEFLQAVGPLFECVLFTASLSRYADPVTDHLDPTGKIFRHRLFRESCHYYQNNYVKNLDDLNRSLDRIVILDNSPVCYCFHPRHAVPISSWFDDPNDTVLLQMIPFFQRLALASDVTLFLDTNEPPGLEMLSEHDRDLVSGVGNTVFARPIRNL